jgi:hypothetical protein
MMDAVCKASEMSAASSNEKNTDYCEELGKEMDDRCLILIILLPDY